MWTEIGLILDIVGAGVLFFFSNPQPNLEEGVGLALEDTNVLNDGKTVAQHNAEIRMKYKAYKIVSRIALALMFLGFVFQFLGTLSK